MSTVSVLLPVRNAMPYLPVALFSVDWQSAPPIEVILVNDGSVDGSLQILEKWTPRYTKKRVVNHIEGTRGLTHALNHGLNLCLGDYVARQDADDYSWYERFKMQAKYLDVNPDTVCVSCRVQYIDGGGNILRDQKRKSTWFPVTQLRFGRNCVAHGSIMFRRSLLQEIGGYRKVFEKSQDHDLLLHLSRFGRVVVLPEILYSLRQHENQISRKERGEQRGFMIAAMWSSAVSYPYD